MRLNGIFKVEKNARKHTTHTHTLWRKDAVRAIVHKLAHAHTHNDSMKFE